MVNNKIIEIILNNIKKLYTEFITLRSKFIPQGEYESKKTNLIYKIKDLKQTIYDLAVIENQTINTLQNEINKDENLALLELNKRENLQKIYKSYKQVNWLSSYLGIMQAETIAESEFPQTNVVKFMNEAGEDKIDHFFRLILETSTLSCIAVLLRENNTSGTGPSRSRKLNLSNQELPALKNFETIPWLKDFYLQKIGDYEKLVSSDISKSKNALLIKELSKLGKELHRSKLFKTDDFFARYGLEKEAKELKDIMGDMTDTGRMSLNFDYVSNFLSFIDTEEDSEMSKNELAHLNKLIDYLSKESIIFDNQGHEIFDTVTLNPNIKDAYNKMKSIIGSSDFLALNTPLILKFLKASFGLGKENQDIKVQDANNQVLSSWIFYILVKFLPNESNDFNSLNARIAVFKQLMDQNIQANAKINSVLFQKMVKKARGLNSENNSTESNNENGVLKSLCLDLEKHINWHISKDNQSKIKLDELLEMYKDVENNIKQNPKSHQKVLEALSKLNNKNELLKPLSQSLIHLYEKNPDIILKFVKTADEKSYKDQFLSDLLFSINDSIKILNIENQSYKVMDSDEKNIDQILKILDDINCLGYAIGKNSKTIELNSNLFNLNNNRIEKIEESIKNIDRFLKTTISIEKNENFPNDIEVFANQYKKLTKLRRLIPAQTQNYNELQLSI